MISCRDLDTISHDIHIYKLRKYGVDRTFMFYDL